MSVAEKKMGAYQAEYKGADVEQAITNACDALAVTREALAIQVVSTGSAGFFGLGRRKAVIRVSLRAASREAAPVAAAGEERSPEKATAPAPAAAATGGQQTPVASVKAGGPARGADESKPVESGSFRAEEETRESRGEPLTPQELAVVENTVARTLELSLGAAEIRLEQEDDGGKLLINLDSSQRERLVGPQGQTLDALQYLLRKIVSKQLGKRVVLELDAAGFRAERRDQLKDQALALAAEVKNSGKTRSMAAMGPAERRIVHLALQPDSEVRSRSVGEGIFKKVLIHPPGKGRRRRKR